MLASPETDPARAAKMLQTMRDAFSASDATIFSPDVLREQLALASRPAPATRTRFCATEGRRIARARTPPVSNGM